MPGVTVSQRVMPLDRVGCYVPGGRYPLPSSLLMTAIPARVAGVPEVVVCSPSVDPVVLAAAVEAGVDRVFRLGGAHAVAAMAYGTATVPRVSKIVGPGQPLGVGRQGAGRRRLPDRLLRRPDRDPDRGRARAGRRGSPPTSSRRPNTTPTRGRCSSRRAARWRRAVAEEVARQLPAHGPAATSLWNHGGIIVTRSMAEAEALANDAAAEHLVVDTEARARAHPPCRRGLRRRRGRRRSPATTPSARITRCRPPASPACAAACTPPTS